MKHSTSLSSVAELENMQNINFSDFYIIGVDRGILSGQKALLAAASLQPAQILDSYPKKSSSTIINVVDYCFPQGVKIDLVPVTVAKNLSGPGNTLIYLYYHTYTNHYCNIAFDQFHIIQFCDSNGKLSYGCCLTITEHMDVPNDTTLENLRIKIMHESASNKVSLTFNI